MILRSAASRARGRHGHGSAVMQMLRDLCQNAHARPVPVPVPTAIDPLDAVLPRHGLDRGAVHEWIGTGDSVLAHDTVVRDSMRSSHWRPPLTMLMHLSCAAIKSARSSHECLVWIGKAVWPYASALASMDSADEHRILSRSLFVRADHPADRLWAADLSLRSGVAAAVIADGSDFDLAATRRLQLASEAGGALCLLSRPPWEQSNLSAASTRWCVRCCPSPRATRRWTVELLRCKGVQPTTETAGFKVSSASGSLWLVEHCHATRAVVVVPGIFDRLGSSQTQPTPIRRIA